MGPLSWALAALQMFAVLVFGWSMLYAKAHRLDVRLFSHLHVNEWHHLYLGLLLWLAGLVVGWRWLEIVGVIVTWDDAYQHAFQAFHHRVRFRSPLHRLYERVFVWFLEHF